MSEWTAADDKTNSDLSSCCADELSAYDPAGQGVKVREDTVRPLDPGPFQFNADIAHLGDISLVRVHIGGKSTGTTVTDPDQLTFVMPLSWTGDFLLNGEPADSSSLYLMADTNCLHILADRRCVLGVCLPRTAFIETIAALRGVEPENLTAADRLLTHAPPAARALRRRLAGIVDASVNQGLPYPAEEMAHDVFGLLVDAYFAARPAAIRKGQRTRQWSRIVRKAEECFMAAEGNRVSLADLCAGAGVSKSVLYLAFQHVCGQPPIHHFYERRMVKAQRALLRSSPRRGAVKIAALGAGFTELGRFSVEYRRLFGESPSATLNCGQGDL